MNRKKCVFRWTLGLVGLAVLNLAGEPLHAQQIALVGKPADECVPSAAFPDGFSALTKAYYSGEWAKLQTLIQKLLKERKPVAGNELLDITSPILVSLVGDNSAAKDPEFVRILVDPEPYVNRLHGTTGLTEVFVGSPKGEQGNSLYSFKRTKNPMEATLAAFAKKVTPADLFDGLDLTKGIMVAPATPPCDMTTMALHLEITPYTWTGARGVLSVTSLATIPGTPPKQIASSTTYENIPFERWSLGLAEVAILEESGAERAKVEGGKIARDPLKGALTVGLVNWHPRAYDPGRFAPSQAERLRVFAGYVFGSDPGITAGVSYLLFRGLSVNAGYGWLQVKSPDEGLNFGDTVPTGSDGLRREIREVAFAGFGYNF